MTDKIIDIEKAFSKQYIQQVENVKTQITNTSPHILSDKEVWWQGEKLLIFSRKYIDERISLTGLDDIEQTILHCIFTNHHDGYVRQKHFQALLNTLYPEIAVPFVFRLLGEYVFEICLDVEIFFEKFPDVCTQFLLENPKYWATQKSRVISYWNEFYRHANNENIISKRYYERLEAYPIWQLVNKMDSELELKKAQQMDM